MGLAGGNKERVGMTGGCKEGVAGGGPVVVEEEGRE